MCTLSCKRLPLMFRDVLDATESQNIELSNNNSNEIKETLELCKFIIEILDNAIIENDGKNDAKVFYSAYKTIRMKCECIEGFRGCSLYKNIVILEKYENVDSDNKTKAEVERKLLDSILRIRYFLRCHIEGM